jgi:hypothetical protein
VGPGKEEGPNVLVKKKTPKNTPLPDHAGSIPEVNLGKNIVCYFY